MTGKRYSAEFKAKAALKVIRGEARQSARSRISCTSKSLIAGVPPTRRSRTTLTA